MIPSNYYSQNVNLLNLADHGPYDGSDYDDYPNHDNHTMNPNFNHIPDSGRYQNEISEPNYYSAENGIYQPEVPLNDQFNNINNNSFNTDNNYNNNNNFINNNNNNNFYNDDSNNDGDRFYNNHNLNFRPSSRNFSEVGSVAGSINPYNNINNNINNNNKNNFRSSNNNLLSNNLLNNSNNLLNNVNNFNNYPYNNIINSISSSTLPSKVVGNMPADMVSNVSQDMNQLTLGGSRLNARPGSSQMGNNGKDLTLVKNTNIIDRPYSRNSNNPNIEKRISPYVLSSDPPGLLNSSYRPHSTSILNRSQSANQFIPADVDGNNQKPELAEVIDFLSHHSDGVKANAAAYLQHLCYMDDNAKVQTRVLRGIPPLLELVSHPQIQVHRAACGALRNISYGRANDDNKREIKNLGGVATLVRLVRKTNDQDIMELVTGIIWNLSSCSDIKKPIIDEGLKTLMDQIIIPYSGWRRPNQNQPADVKPHYRSTVFRNASGVLRNISSDGEYARKKMRECEGLIQSLAFVVGVSLTNQDCDNKSVENCVCVLRNLSYACQEVADPDYLNNRLLAMSGKDGKSGCFGNKSKSSSKQKSEASKNNLAPSYDQSKQNPEMSYLWSPKILDIYLPLLKDCSNPDTVEATAGAIQNLAACDWQPSIDMRSAVRYNQGLPTIIGLLGYSSDKVIYSASTALRNLAIDEKNKELIGKYATKDLTNKLPTSSDQEFILSNDTLAAIESTLYEVVKSNSTFAKLFIKEGGVDRLMNITKSPPGIFDEKVVRYAKQLLQKVWKYNEFHDELKKSGWKAADFTFPSTNPGNKSSAENTINRPIMNQGRGYQDNNLKFNNNNLKNNNNVGLNFNNNNSNIGIGNNNNNNNVGLNFNNNSNIGNNNNNIGYQGNVSNKPSIKFDNDASVRYSVGDISTANKPMMKDEDIALDVLQNMELHNDNTAISYNTYSPNTVMQQQQQLQHNNINNFNVDGNINYSNKNNFEVPFNNNNNNVNAINNNINNNSNRHLEIGNYSFPNNNNNNVINNTTFTTLPGYSNENIQYNYNNNDYHSDNGVVIGDSDAQFISGNFQPNSSGYNMPNNNSDLSLNQLYSKVQRDPKFNNNNNNNNNNINNNNNNNTQMKHVDSFV